jgi:pimeloyl-ACP methyl ester carboxylesterase
MKQQRNINMWIFGALFTLSLGLFPSSSFAESELPYVEPADCAIEVPADADLECGVLVAPENYALPEGRQVRMPYIILHSPSPDSGQTPVLFTEGGPGGTSLQSVWGFKDSVLLQDRDVIIFEQRGNLFADPALACTMEELHNEEDGTSPCYEKLKAMGIDFTQYTTAVLAEDIESLRLALGIEQWDLFGTSYSTRLVQVLMDRHPEGIRAAIMQSVSPVYDTRHHHDPEHSYLVLQVMFEDCAADPDCASAYPDLESQFFNLVADLNDSPIELTLENPGDGSPIPYQVSGDTLINWMVGRAFYGPTFPPYTSAYYPLLISQLAEGKTGALESWALNEIQENIFAPDFIAFGLYFTVNCQDDASLVSRAEIDALAAVYPDMDGFYRHLAEWNLCQIWDLPTAPPLADQPIRSEIPSLVLAGRYDPITPPRWAQEVANNLPNSYYVEFPSKGHNLDAGTSCAEEIKRSFLQDPWREPDTSCLASEPPPQYVLPQEGFYMPGYLDSLDDINMGVPDQGKPILEGLTWVSMLIFLIEVIFILVLVFRVVGAKPNRKSKAKELNLSQHAFAGIAAVISIATVQLNSSVVHQFTNQTDWMFNLVGLPRSEPLVITVGVLTALQLLAAASLLVMGILLWVRKHGTLFNRILFTLGTLSVIVFSYFLVRWDMVNIFLSWLGIL